jgi:hypothetical protein
MQLPNIKQLRELLKLLRSQGVLQYQSTDLNLVLSEQAPVTAKSRAAEAMESDEEELTPEQEYERLLFYSSPAADTDPKPEA